jgi:hypothetical protein
MAVAFKSNDYKDAEQTSIGFLSQRHQFLPNKLEIAFIVTVSLQCERSFNRFQMSCHGNGAAL